MRKPSRLTPMLIALNVVTAVIAVSALTGESVVPRAQAAEPQPEDKGGSPFNATEQRKQMIAQLDVITRKLGDLEKKLNTGINVKVTEMPEVVVKDPSKKK